jgi:organic hydroperoxide reductase OsmC/OhrA
MMLVAKECPMGEHHASVHWKRVTPDFTYETYVRDHTWTFKNGQCIAASSAPVYRGNAELLDPEEALIASISSCHMLTFLAIAARKRYVIDAYEDHAVGILEKNEIGRQAITRVTLHPKITFGGDYAPILSEIRKMHDHAHRECFIANSLKTEVTVAMETPA